ncbi:EexN family lipoprotein [Perlucidibaca aquatica]|uniref:EexN family lipoprotein n=1 Tax=Perlucidibaca aquatica TaxID=1852776 RepID=UPI00083A6158|nr:EexN family lipoprotein [Perlucidibaca aquatica]
MTTRHLALCLSLFMSGALGLVGCSQPAPDITVEYLVAHPDELKALQQKCRLERDTLDERVCVIVSEAQHRRFWGDGKTRYTPGGGVRHE